MNTFYSEKDLFTVMYYDVERLKEYIRSGGNINIRDADIPNYNKRNICLLHQACVQVNAEAVRFLLENGIEVNRQDNNGDTPLHIAAISTDSPSIIGLLVEYGADTEIKDCMGLTPLLFACIYDNFENVKELVKRGANIHATDMHGDSCLHVSSENKEILSFLMEMGADPNAKNDEGDTPLHSLFIKNKNFDFLFDENMNGENLKSVILLFIQYGSNIYIKNNFGKSVIDVCFNQKIKEYMLQIYSEMQDSQIKEPC
jgi:ankyrin repeat protein